jgi:glutaredoxin
MQGVPVAETGGENPQQTRDAAATPPAETSADAPENAPATRECPYCHKTIRADILVCRFCGHDLVATRPTKLVLSQETWNTDIPQWLIDEDQKAQRRQQLIRKLQRLQWPTVVTILSVAVLAILWRVIFPPPAPQDQVRTLPRYGRANSAPPETPAPTATPTPHSLGGFAATDSPPPTATAQTPSGQAPSTASSFSSAPDTASTTTSAPGPDIITTAQDIAAEFQDARSLAEDKYNGLNIRVSGIIRRIDTSGVSASVLFATVGKRPPVKCLLKPSERAKLTRMKPGQLAQLRGTCEGAFLEVILTDCVIEF